MEGKKTNLIISFLTNSYYDFLAYKGNERWHNGQFSAIFERDNITVVDQTKLDVKYYYFDKIKDADDNVLNPIVYTPDDKEITLSLKKLKTTRDKITRCIRQFITQNFGNDFVLGVNENILDGDENVLNQFVINENVLGGNENVLGGNENVLGGNENVLGNFECQVVSRTKRWMCLELINSKCESHLVHIFQDNPWSRASFHMDILKKDDVSDEYHAVSAALSLAIDTLNTPGGVFVGELILNGYGNGFHSISDGIHLIEITMNRKVFKLQWNENTRLARQYGHHPIFDNIKHELELICTETKKSFFA